MNIKFLARHGSRPSAWAHPYGHGPFSPFLYADGGDDDGSGSDSGDTGTGDGDAAGADGSGDSGAGGTGGTGAGKGGNGTDDSADRIARLEKDLADARKDAGKARTEAKKQAADDAVKEITQKLGEALGIVKGDKPPTAEDLTKALAERDSTLSERDAALRSKDVQLAVHGRAEKNGAKATALLNSVSFLASVKDLDPSKSSFGTDLDAAIKQELKDNPTVALVVPAGKSGGDLSGGTRETSAKRSGSLAGAIKDHYGN